MSVHKVQSDWDWAEENAHRIRTIGHDLHTTVTYREAHGREPDFAPGLAHAKLWRVCPKCGKEHLSVLCPCEIKELT